MFGFSTFSETPIASVETSVAGFGILATAVANTLIGTLAYEALANTTLTGASSTVIANSFGDVDAQATIALLTTLASFDINEFAWLIGYIDFLDVSNSKIVDHKSVKSKKWMLTEKDLAENLQLNIYGYWYLNKIPNKKFVYYRHNQLNKQIPDACEFVEVKMKRDDVIDYWNTEVMPCVDEIIELKRQAVKEKFLCNKGACGDYGGCDYKKNCESCGYN